MGQQIIQQDPLSPTNQLLGTVEMASQIDVLRGLSPACRDRNLGKMSSQLTLTCPQ